MGIAVPVPEQRREVRRPDSRCLTLNDPSCTLGRRAPDIVLH